MMAHFMVFRRAELSLTVQRKQTLSKNQLFIHPDVGSLLHVTATLIKIVPLAHVHSVLTVMSRTS